MPAGGVAAGPAGVPAVDGCGVQLATIGCGYTQLGAGEPTAAAIVDFCTDALYEVYLLAIALRKVS